MKRRSVKEFRRERKTCTNGKFRATGGEKESLSTSMGGGQNSFGGRKIQPHNPFSVRVCIIGGMQNFYSMGEFVNKKEQPGRQGSFEFSFQNQKLTKEQKAERKIYRRIAKNNYKRRMKIEDNKELVEQLVAGIGEGETLHLLSDSIDSPNIINAYVDRIEEIYISTWSITPAGIACLENLTANGCCRIALLTLDRTHSYKWMFSSGAYKCLQGKVEIRITAIHSKFIVMKLTDGSVLNFVGSMNLSNNPRWENLMVSRDPEDFAFYRDFLLSITAEKLK
nr:MAG TPA: hypothetical protein [Caudoviricetes sp.]